MSCVMDYGEYFKHVRRTDREQVSDLSPGTCRQLTSSSITSLDRFTSSTKVGDNMQRALGNSKNLLGSESHYD